MPGTKKKLSLIDFVAQVTFNSSETGCTWNDVFYKKGDTLASIQIKEILETSNKYNEMNIDTLIVKDNEQLTLWIERKSINKSNKTEEPEKLEENKQAVPSNQELPTKTVTKRYRGQVYEEKVIDWAAIQQLSQHNKPRRKYRGQYIN